MGEVMGSSAKIHDAFKPFIAAADRHLSFLVSEYGFEAKGAMSHPPDCAIVYSAPTIRITAHYEFGSAPWIEMSIKQPSGAWQDAALQSLVKTPTESRNQPLRERSAEDLDRNMRDESERLRAILKRVFTGRGVNIKAAILREREALCADALKVLSSLEESIRGTTLLDKDRQFLAVLRRRLTRSDFRGLRRVLGKDLQLKHRFGSTLEKNVKFSAHVSHLTLALQDCLQ